jgi:hypothetical protein
MHPTSPELFYARTPYAQHRTAKQLLKKSLDPSAVPHIADALTQHLFGHQQLVVKQALQPERLTACSTP